MYALNLYRQAKACYNTTTITWYSLISHTMLFRCSVFRQLALTGQYCPRHQVYRGLSTATATKTTDDVLVSRSDNGVFATITINRPR